MGSNLTIIEAIIMLFAGVGIFLTGVHLLSSNIEQLANTKIKDLFNKTADNKFINIGIGAATTAIIQSSGVTTVLIVGFVNVGVMSLYQATAMIMGANIGTTITAHIASLQSFDFTTYIQAFAFIGMMMTMIFKSENMKKVGFIVAGLGMIFIGLDLMSTSMKAPIIKDFLTSVFQAVDNPFLLLLIGIVVTALAQSSSATTSIIITMAGAGIVIGNGGNSVLFMIMGTNIGSCVTALMSSFGAGVNAKRASLIHLLFNTLGTAIFVIVLLIWKDFNDTTFMIWFKGAPSVQIAMFHTFFNVIGTLLFVPFANVFVKISTFLIKDKPEVDEIETSLDERMLSTPAVAIEQTIKETVRLTNVSMSAFNIAFDAFVNRNADLLKDARAQIDKSTKLSNAITDYLIKASVNVSSKYEKIISNIHNNVGDIMRISEIADNFIKYTNREIDDNLVFSEVIMEKVSKMFKELNALHELTKQALLTNDKEVLQKVDAVEERVDEMRKLLIDEHIERLNAGKCKAQNSSIFINLVSNMERLGDHLTFIAHTIE